MSSARPLDLELLPGRYSICRLEPDASLPEWAAGGDLVAITRSEHELSVVCEALRVPAGVRHEGPYHALRVRGSLDFGEVGILAALSTALAAAGVPLLAISTFDTDYVLVPAEALESADAALRDAGHRLA